MTGDGGNLISFPQAPDGIELRHLRSFIAVSEELNFGRAAERLYLSQPALSRQIRALEDLVGVELLRRSTHQVELTLAGEALLDRARRIVTDVDEAVSMTQSVGGELIGRAARLWEPVVELGLDGAELPDMRAAYEELHAQFTPPPELAVRPVNAGGVSSFLLTPQGDPPATLMYMHGGGYVMGSAFGYRPLAGALGVAAAGAVVAPEYRLAPEHPFPAAVEDCVAAFRWMLERGTDPRTITIAGDSSGGGLVMSTLLKLRADGLPLPGGAVLFCPWVDLRLELVQRAEDPRSLALTDAAHMGRSAYLGDHPSDDPIVDPLAADLTGLPPLLIQAATGDPRLEDSQALTEHALECGVDARLELYPVETHVFQVFWSFLPEAADALERAGRFARELREGTALRARLQ